MMRLCQRVKDPSWVAVFVVVLLFHHNLGATQTQIFTGPVSLAMGGGGRAGAEASEKMFLNPATVAQAEDFQAGLSWQDGYWAKGVHDSSFSVALLENNPENFAPGGFAYIQRRRTEPGYAWLERYGFGALAKRISPYVTLGVSGYYLSQEAHHATHTQWNGSVGGLLTLSEQFGMAYVYANPVRADDGIPVPMRLVPQQSLAFNWIIPDLMRITFDVTRWEEQNPDNKGILQLGLETKVGDFGGLRVGGQVDDIQKRNMITAGIGFLGPRLRANYAFAKALRETGGAVHGVDLCLPF